jgi:hypothetical protein
MQELKNLLSNSSYFYGPVTKEEAFNVLIPSYATFYNGNWYIGTTEKLKIFEEKEIIIVDNTPVESVESVESN